MTIRFLVNFGLLALPIAITLGVLIGLQSQREASGGPPLFKPDPKPTDRIKKKNGILTEQHCQKSFGIHPETKGQEYTREYILISSVAFVENVGFVPRMHVTCRGRWMLCYFN
jgi:hypothetical protein